MHVVYHGNFLKNYRKRIQPQKKLRNQFKNRLKLFIKDPLNPLLQNHALKGKHLGAKAFSITGNYRVIYNNLSENQIIFLDIGTHNQVY